MRWARHDRPAAARGGGAGREAADLRLGPVRWTVPDQARARRRAALVASVAALLGIWYLAWLLQGRRVGNPFLFGLLIAAEGFNLVQAAGFWWTCARQRVRKARPAADPSVAVDVLIPTLDEPLDVVQPTLAAATRLRGASPRVWLLDDGARPQMAALAEAHGAEYLSREGGKGAKAGNLNNALAHSSAPYVLVLDCDHVPHPDLFERTLGYFEDADLGFVQTPQYYANQRSSSVSAAAAAQQSLFFGPIARGKDGMGAMFCCGTNVIFRRSALESVGGFPEGSVTEDFEMSIHLHERGWRSVYYPHPLASGLGPEDMASYVSQQQRWARGCLGSMAAILRSDLPWRHRLQYMLSATYFLSGWTLLIYMSLPVVRILSGAQPLAAASADQFLLHFAPYYCSALAAVALAGSGTYTFGAFTLAAGSFWIHVQATLSALLRRTARFVVTPKHGERKRQPRAVAPALLALLALVGVAAWGLAHRRTPAVLNNVAFAALHSCVMFAAVLPALRLRRSPPIVPEPKLPEPHAHARRWPIPLTASVLIFALVVPASLSVLGSRTLALRANLSEQAHSAAEHFLDRYANPNGRVVRRDQGGDTVSEGQAYGMLLSVALDDKARFSSVWGWAHKNLGRSDGLLASRWADGRVADPQPATDADLDAARALVLAAERFGDPAYRRAGESLGHAVLEHETTDVGGEPILVAGPWARSSPSVVNPSYFSPRAFDDLGRADHDSRWAALARTSRGITTSLIGAARDLPPDWAQVSSSGSQGELAQPAASPRAGQPGGAAAPSSGLDGARVAIRSAESCLPPDRRIAALLWDRYRAAPGRIVYSLGGSPTTSELHPASLVAAAAAADGAGRSKLTTSLLDRAQRLDSQSPTYYGAAWVALGRVMLTSSALGSCPGR